MHAIYIYIYIYIYLFFLHPGTEKNLLEIKPAYNFWAPFLGSDCRRGRFLFNSEFRKINHKEDVQTAGATTDNCSIEALMDLFCKGKVRTQLFSTVFQLFQLKSYQ